MSALVPTTVASVETAVDTTFIDSLFNEKLYVVEARKHIMKTSKMKLNYISTPNLTLKRKLAEYMKVYNLDEFRTSCLNYKTEEKCENIYLPDKKAFKERYIQF